MVVTKEMIRFLENFSKKTEKSTHLYSVIEYPQYTEIVVTGEDDKGRKFCRIIPYRK